MSWESLQLDFNIKSKLLACDNRCVSENGLIDKTPAWAKGFPRINISPWLCQYLEEKHTFSRSWEDTELSS